MSEPVIAHSPIVIDRVERTRGEGDRVRLRLSGRPIAAGDHRFGCLLVVHVHGRRHRFAPEDGEPQTPLPDVFEATFVVPDWAVPIEHGQAALWVGAAAVPVPPVGTKPRAWAPADLGATAGAGPALDAPLAPDAGFGSDPATAPGVDLGRAGPLADALGREQLSALRAELDRRAGLEAELQGSLEGVRAELAARVRAQSELEATQAELRAELARLVEAVATQQAAFEQRLAQERARLDDELAAAQAIADERLATARAAADDELAAVRAAADDQVAAARAAGDDQLASARSAAAAELEQVRASAETERAASAAELERLRAEIAAARSQQADYVRAREQLAASGERLAAAATAEQVRAQEIAAMREQLVVTQIARDAAISETGGLRAELARVGSELAVTREVASGANLGAAQQLLEDARALTAQLRTDGPQ